MSTNFWRFVICQPCYRCTTLWHTTRQGSLSRVYVLLITEYMDCLINGGMWLIVYDQQSKYSGLICFSQLVVNCLRCCLQFVMIIMLVEVWERQYISCTWLNCNCIQSVLMCHCVSHSLVSFWMIHNLIIIHRLRL